MPITTSSTTYKNNIDIHPDAINSPATQKKVGNIILQSDTANDLNVMWYIFFDKRYAAPQLLGIMRMEWDLLAAATCRANRKGFSMNELDLDADIEQGDFIQKVDPCLVMAVIRWKDSKVLQTINITMEKGTTSVS
eukprot:2937821-Ditylum_brightwellii.AAC.1